MDQSKSKMSSALPPQPKKTITTKNFTPIQIPNSSKNQPVVPPQSNSTTQSTSIFKWLGIAVVFITLIGGGIFVYTRWDFISFVTSYYQTSIVDDLDACRIQLNTQSDENIMSVADIQDTEIRQTTFCENNFNIVTQFEDCFKSALSKNNIAPKHHDYANEMLQVTSYKSLHNEKCGAFASTF